jgi:hypothetical protein
MRSRWSTFTALDRATQRQVIEAAIVLAAIWLGVRTVGYGGTRRAVARAGRSNVKQPHTATDVLPVAQEWAWAVAAGARAMPLPATCLHRTVALWWLLRRRGIESEIRFGTVRTEDGLAAHAWLEREGVVLNDDADVGEKFAALKAVRP